MFEATHCSVLNTSVVRAVLAGTISAHLKKQQKALSYIYVIYYKHQVNLAVSMHSLQHMVAKRQTRPPLAPVEHGLEAQIHQETLSCIINLCHPQRLSRGGNAQAVGLEGCCRNVEDNRRKPNRWSEEDNNATSGYQSTIRMWRPRTIWRGVARQSCS